MSATTTVTAAGASTRGRPRIGPLGHLQRPGSTRVLEMSAGSEVRRSVLPAGLRVITERVPSVRSVSVGLWVGSAPATNGPRSRVPRTTWNTCCSREPRDARRRQIAEEIDAVGGELNAFTAKEHTCYYAHVLDADLPLAVDLVADVVFEAICAPRVTSRSNAASCSKRSRCATTTPRTCCTTRSSRRCSASTRWGARCSAPRSRFSDMEPRHALRVLQEALHDAAHGGRRSRATSSTRR